MESKPTAVLADFIKHVSFDDLPEEVVAKAKLCLLDYFAAALAGFKINHIFNKALWKVVSGLGGKRESRILFQEKKLAAPQAAFLNAAYGHGADLDDGHRTAQGHPGVVVIPVALSLAEAHRLNGRDTLLAIVTGYDIFVRLATAINPSQVLRGFHTTGTVGAIAAGATAAKALRLPFEEIKNALSLAALQSAGLLEVAESGQMAKPLLPAKAVFNGILAARLAEAGAEGPGEALEGRKGFIRAFADQADMAVLWKDLGKRFSISSCYFKLYPACRHTHAAVDAAISLREKGLVSLNHLKKVKIHIYPAAISLTGNIYQPKNADEAKFSLPYTVARALQNGKFTLQDLDVASGLNREIQELISRIEIISDPLLENRGRNIRGARLELTMKDGSTRTEAVNLPKGDPEVPVTHEDIAGKFRSCAENIFSQKRGQAIIAEVQKMDNLEDIDYLTKLFTLKTIKYFS